jgi:hypothetical protein
MKFKGVDSGEMEENAFFSAQFLDIFICKILDQIGE